MEIQQQKRPRILSTKTKLIHNKIPLIGTHYLKLLSLRRNLKVNPNLLDIQPLSSETKIWAQFSLSDN